MRPGRLTAALGLCVVLAACGGGDDDPLSQEEFVVEGDRICRAAQERQQNLRQPTDERTLVAYLDRTEQIARDMQEQLEELEPPDDAGEEVLSALRAVLDEGSALARTAKATSARRGFPAAVDELQNSPHPADDRSERLARAYGFSACGADG